MARRARSDDSDSSVSAAASAITADRKRYVTWDARAAQVLLRLRFDTMQRAFASRTNPLEVAALWTTLAAHLQRLTGRAFTTAQCQGKLKALRTKWRVGLRRQGQQQQQTNPESFEKHALKWIVGVNAQKRARDKAKKKGTQPSQQRLEAPSESFAELLASLEASTGTNEPERAGHAEDDYDCGFGNDDNDQQDVDVEQQAARVRKDESSLLALLRRQTTAVEAISSTSSSSAHGEWLELSREQTRLAREQVELNLFLVRADPEDAVAQEYLMLKRSQARDRLKNEAVAQSQQIDGVYADPARDVSRWRSRD